MKLIYISLLFLCASAIAENDMPEGATLGSSTLTHQDMIESAHANLCAALYTNISLINTRLTDKDLTQDDLASFEVQASTLKHQVQQDCGE